MEKYSLLLQWSEEDGVFLVTCPEFEGHLMQPFAHGSTWEEASREGAVALTQVIEVMRDTGMILPAPRLYIHGVKNGSES